MTYYGSPDKCDKCGRFHNAGPGSSWVHVPAIDVPGHQSGDERTRCAKCTEGHGPAEAFGDYVLELVQGVIK